MSDGRSPGLPLPSSLIAERPWREPGSLGAGGDPESLRAQPSAGSLVEEGGQESAAGAVGTSASPREQVARGRGQSAWAYLGEGQEGRVGTCRPQTKGCSHTAGGSGVGARCWEDEVSYAPDMKRLPSSRPCRPRCGHRAPLFPWSRKVGRGTGQEQVGAGVSYGGGGGPGGAPGGTRAVGVPGLLSLSRQRSPRPGSLSLVLPEWGHVSAESTPVSRTLPTCFFVSCYFWVHVLTFFHCSLEYPQAVTPGFPAGPVPLSSVLRD